MWKKGKTWALILPMALSAILLTGAVALIAWFNWYIGVALAVPTVVLIVYTGVRIAQLDHDVRRYVGRTVSELTEDDPTALNRFPIAALAVSADGEMLYANRLFTEQVSDNPALIGNPLSTLLSGITPDSWRDTAFLDVQYGTKQYSVFIRKNTTGEPAYILFFVDDTDFKEIAAEYRASRPAVMMLYIDNMDEVLQNARESERARLSGLVENLLEDWLADAGGILRKFDDDRFLAMIEHRHLQQAIDTKFAIMDQVRAINTADNMRLTMSIGIGVGETMRDCELSARQALEMALGRGGDQVAIKVENEYHFFGGVSAGVEKHNKVRSRVMAAAIGDAIAECDRVLVMGHRFSDLDALGSAIGMAALARGLGKPAYVVVDRDKSVAKELIDSYSQAHPDAFIAPDKALALVNPNTLLIITDTFRCEMLESAELYQRAKSVVVIDHHRKMVGHINRALLVYHEPYASSASEMVTEMIPYLNNKAITRIEAEALLAGIMLDTRSFVVKVGVRTFEAAAALRRFGADTIKVKKLFAGSMDMYQTKAEIVAKAEMYRQTAISCHDAGGSELRVASAQAADELLSVQDVRASFTMFTENGEVYVSARSLGDFNVQLVMEELGGGGHLMMAGAQLKDTTLEQAKARVMEAIDHYLDINTEE